MGLRKPIVDNRTAEQILQDMTQIVNIKLHARNIWNC